MIEVNTKGIWKNSVPITLRFGPLGSFYVHLDVLRIALGIFAKFH